MDWFEGWNLLKMNYPIDIKDLAEHCNEFQSLIRINRYNLELSKERLVRARGKLVLAINSLYTQFFEREAFKGAEDYMVFYLLKDDLNRVLQSLEALEQTLIIQREKGFGLVTLASLELYISELKIVHEGVLYNSMKKAKLEYSLIKEAEKKNKRTFLYILFQMISNSVGLLGGQARAKGASSFTKSPLSGLSVNYDTMMSDKGKSIIQKTYASQTGMPEKTLKDDMEEIRLLLASPEPDEEVFDIGGDLEVSNV